MPDYKAIGKGFARERGINELIFERQIQRESGWQHWSAPNVVKANPRSGALGFGQLMPPTARELGVNPMDPVDNLRGAATYLYRMLERYGGNYAKALAAYNWGPGRVDQWNGSRATLPTETREYLDDILGPNWAWQPGQTPTPSPPPGLPTLPSLPTLPNPVEIGSGIVTGIGQAIGGWWQRANAWPKDEAIERLSGTGLTIAGVGLIAVGLTGAVLKAPPTKVGLKIASAVGGPQVRTGARVASAAGELFD